MTTAIDTIENDFRVWAFHAYYSAYANEANLSHRFVRAIVESAKPVPADRLMAWKAAHKDIRKIAGRFNRGEIDRAEWATQVQAAIFAHTGKETRNRAWQGEPAEVPSGEGWCPAAPLDTPPMRAGDRAEVIRKLVELNGEIL